MIYKITFLPLLLCSTLTAFECSQASENSEVTSVQSGDNKGSGPFQGTIGFISSSFLYKSSARGTSSSYAEGTVKDEFNSNTFHAAGDLEFYSFIKSAPAVGAESRQLYLQFQKDYLGDAQVTVGRKLYEWSKLDKTWTMMSLWSPRWTWDELHPELIGMTGAFLTYDTRRFHFVLFGSPLSIPERGTSTYEKDRNIVSDNPLWKPLPTQITAFGNTRNLHYSLLTPPLQDILFRPNFAARGRYDFESGIWVSANTGVLPVNMIQMAAEPFVDASTTADLQVNIRPQFPMRNINTAEAGFEGKDFDLWTSASYEQPFHFENQPNWLNPIITPSSILSAGANVKLAPELTLSGAIIFIHEQPFNRASNLPPINVQLPSRFPLKQGVKLGGNWKLSEQTQTDLTWIEDLLEHNHFVSLDAEHVIRKTNLTLGAGTDLLFASSNKGWVGQYYGSDRLRGWLRYAF